MELNEIDKKMEKAIENMEENFSEIRAGRANPGILNKVKVDYYGVETPINQVASISVPEPRMIVIKAWDKSLTNEINRAIEKADIGINPQKESDLIRLVFPELTEERRKELVKKIKKYAEETKVAIRNVRRDGIDLAKKEQKDNGISEDEERDLENKIQKITDEKIKKVDEIAEKKEKEIMTV